MPRRKRAPNVNKKILEDAKAVYEEHGELNDIIHTMGYSAVTASRMKASGFDWDSYQEITKSDNRYVSVSNGQPSDSQDTDTSKDEESNMTPFKEKFGKRVNQKICEGMQYMSDVLDMTVSEISEKTGFAESTIYYVRTANFDFEEYQKQYRQRKIEEAQKKAAESTEHQENQILEKNTEQAVNLLAKLVKRVDWLKKEVDSQQKKYKELEDRLHDVEEVQAQEIARRKKRFGVF